MKGRLGSGRLPKGVRGSSSSLHTLVSAATSQKLHVLLGVAALCLVYVLSSTLSFRHQGSSLLRSTNNSLAVATALNAQVGGLNLGQYGSEMLRLAVRKAISPADAALHSRDVRQEDTAEFEDLLAKIQSLVWKLGTAIPPETTCSWDPTLHVNSLLGQDGTQKYLLAADMHNNEALLPHFMAQLLHFLSVMPQGSVFVSLYESGSTDSTGAWLDLLRNIMAAMRVPHRVITGGRLTRAPNQDRIDFLAEARNRALEPLWLNTSFPGEGGLLPPRGEGKGSYWSMHDINFGQAKPLWQADRVIFLNDVYFCARDIVRLLQHDADMVCGMDFDRPRLQDAPEQVQRRLFAEDLWQRFMLPVAIGRELGRLGHLRLSWRKEGSRADDLYQVASPLEFYDIWVARDSDGQQFLKKSPYVTDPYSLQRIRAGLPFPVKCCWNGLVVMRSTPFVQQNLRMRMHREGECAASECTLLCNDLLRLGYQRFVVDPGVRQAYRPRDVKVLYDPRFVQGVPLTDWADIAHSRPIDWRMAPFRPYYQCCGLKPGWDMVEWDKDCQWDNFLTPNYTAMRGSGKQDAPYVSANISYFSPIPEIHFLQSRRGKFTRL